MDEELIVGADQEGRFVGEHRHAVDEQRDVKFADLEKSWFVCKVNENVFQCTNNISFYFTYLTNFLFARVNLSHDENC